MRRFAIGASIATLMTVLTATSSAAYLDVGHDGRDAPSYDIRSTGRLVKRTESGRILRVVIRTYEKDFYAGDYLTIRINLDVRGGPRADARIRIGVYDLSGRECFLHSGADHVQGRLSSLSHSTRTDRIGCTVPIRGLHPTKRIRWKVVYVQGEAGESGDDAPNSGWYG